MNDLVEYNPLGVKGHVRIELYDAETGELSEMQEGNNFISFFMLGVIMRQAQKAIFVGCANGGVFTYSRFYLQLRWFYEVFSAYGFDTCRVSND